MDMHNPKRQNMPNRRPSPWAILTIAAVAILAVVIATNTTYTTSTSPASFHLAPQLNNSKNNSANQTCGPGSYCYTQITLLNSYLYPWYGQTGNALTFLMDRTQLLTYGEVLLGMAVLLEFPMLLLYFNKKFKAVENRKVGPDDKKFWLIAPAVMRAALAETESGREVIRKWDEQSTMEAVQDIQVAILKAKKLPKSREA
jgi:hypothetical protein